MAILLWTTAASQAGVTSDTVYRTHWVGGTTPRTIVSSMGRNPVNGDHGGAYANIHPTYALSFDTAERGGSCRTRDVELDMRFVITLPASKNEARMSSRTRAAWRAFVEFARRHELEHRSSYLECGQALVQQVQAARAATCVEVRREVRQMLSAAKRNCDAKQAAFDRAERSRLAGLALFRLGR